MEKDYETLVQAVPEVSAISLHDFMVSWILPLSRYFQLRGFPGENTLVPIAGDPLLLSSRHV